MLKRRSFLKGLSILLTAPAAVMSGRATASEALEAVQRQVPIEAHLTEKRLKAAIQKVWESGKDTIAIYMSHSANRDLMESAGTTLFYPRQDKGSGNILETVDVYVSDFGEHTILPWSDMSPHVSVYHELVPVRGVAYMTLGVVFPAANEE